MKPQGRLMPKITPETAHFWKGCKEGELRLQRCDACAHTYFPPRPFCPVCAHDRVSVVVASGRARLYSYAISHIPAPGLEPPFAVAVVTLDEGPRMMTNITGCPQEPGFLELDMPLRVTFLDLSDEVALPLFTPEGAA